MAIFPGAMNALPGVYGPTDYYFTYQDSTLKIGWDGGIFLYKGSWIEAAIALRIKIPEAFVRHENFRGWGHIGVDKNFEISLHIPVEGSSYGPPERGWNYGKPVNAEHSLNNFPHLKYHYDKIKSMKAFW